ncbi:hypothetical protein BU15DRAFT_80530 [Melanogaster broomeanus]|nr:hypothetical protein BU15DRAFT_80530 [Melanogaster broomeanus]
MSVEPKVSQLKCKPYAKHALYKPCKPGVAMNKDSPQSASQPLSSHQKSNLTLHDWLTVFAYVDAHLGISQDVIVQHFKTYADGTLIFDQSTLSCKLRDREKLEAHHALFLWVKHMEEKQEMVNDSMLIAKQVKFENSLGVPEEEQLQGDGWIPKFKKAYGIKEYHRHSKAASVDLAAVDAERAHLRIVWAKYSPQDRFNFNETSLFAFPVSNVSATSHSSLMMDAKAWMVINTFMTSDELSLPDVEHQLHDTLEDCYLATDWDLVLKIVMDVENDTSKALEGLDVFTLRIFGCPLTQLTPLHAANHQEVTATVTPPQLSEAE